MSAEDAYAELVSRRRWRIWFERWRPRRWRIGGVGGDFPGATLDVPRLGTLLVVTVCPSPPGSWCGVCWRCVGRSS